MMFYSKVIAAAVGMLALLLTRYGLEVDEPTQKLIIDGLVAIGTVISVYLLKNKPTTPAQVDTAKAVVAEGAAKVFEKETERQVNS